MSNLACGDEYRGMSMIYVDWIISIYGARGIQGWGLGVGWDVWGGGVVEGRDRRDGGGGVGGVKTNEAET